MWYPLIFKRSDGVYFAASGQHQSRYLGNCLLAVALLFGGSLLIFLAAAGPRSGSLTNRRIPSSNLTAGRPPKFAEDPRRISQ